MCVLKSACLGTKQWAEKCQVWPHEHHGRLSWQTTAHVQIRRVWQAIPRENEKQTKWVTNQMRNVDWNSL